MLHEVLLALSGHPSPLFDQPSDTFPLISPAESALFASVGRLATLHRALKSHLARISACHPSLICRAVASSVATSQLSKFQDLILDVERQILSKNPSTVGAYDIVPLAGIVAKFKPWNRRFDWYWELACFMYPADAEPLTDDSGSAPFPICTGPAVVNKLRSDSQTGYPDVEEAALTLLAVAERAWLRQLSGWLLNGTMPRNGKHDFFVYQDKSRSSSSPNYAISKDLIPIFVTEETADSILFIGKTLGMLLSRITETVRDGDSLISSTSQLRLHTVARPTVDTSQLQKFASLQSPIGASVFSSLITNLRSSVALKVVDEILPINLLMRTLFLLRRFMLVGRGDFTDALIAEADAHIATRHQQARLVSNGSLAADLAGVMMKEGEVSAVFAKVWIALSPMITKEKAVDEELEWAREHISLRFVEPTSSNPQVTKRTSHDIPFPPLSAGLFEELLLSSPASLSLNLDSAFDLFLGADERQAYSTIHSYLLGIRRAHNHLSDIWRQSALRRDHPAPIRRGRAKKAFQVLREVRRKRMARMQALRPIWSTCNNAVVTLAELGEYLSGEVVGGAWDTFHAWAFQNHAANQPVNPQVSPSSPSQLPRDPEILAQGHRQFIVALVDALLLNHTQFTKNLKSLCIHIDQLVAFVRRLETIQREIDLRDEGVMTGGKRNLDEEERDLYEQLSNASELVADDLKRLLRVLQELSSNPLSWRNFRHSVTGFEPYDGRMRISHLVMKLEFNVEEPIEE